MLTNENIAILKAPFAPDEHEFLKGNAYITEYAITARIEQIDPSWSLEQINLTVREHPSTKKLVATCTIRLTICGVSRDGVGMADVTLTKDGSNEANEAEKSAATDAMKRAARLFGIGRYLLNLPDNVRDPVSMKAYLQRGQRPTTPPAAQNAANPPSNANPIWFDVAVGEAWTDIKKYLIAEKIYSNEHEMKASMAKRGVVVDNKIAEEWKHVVSSKLVEFLKTRHEEKQPA